MRYPCGCSTLKCRLIWVCLLHRLLFLLDYLVHVAASWKSLYVLPAAAEQLHHLTSIMKHDFERKPHIRCAGAQLITTSAIVVILHYHCVLATLWTMTKITNWMMLQSVEHWTFHCARPSGTSCWKMYQSVTLSKLDIQKTQGHLLHRYLKKKGRHAWPISRSCCLDVFLLKKSLDVGEAVTLSSVCVILSWWRLLCIACLHLQPFDYTWWMRAWAAKGKEHPAPEGGLFSSSDHYQIICATTLLTQ